MSRTIPADIEPGSRLAARHCHKEADYGDCEVGWHIEAVPCIEEVNGCRAMFLYHKHDHPVWLIGAHMRTVHPGEPDEESFLAGSRLYIPQEGSPGHLHWLTEGSEHMGTSYPSSLAAVEELFGVDVEHSGDCPSEGPDLDGVEVERGQLVAEMAGCVRRLASVGADLEER